MVCTFWLSVYLRILVTKIISDKGYICVIFLCIYSPTQIYPRYPKIFLYRSVSEVKNSFVKSYNLRTPLKHDSRCALFSLSSFVATNSTPQREAQRMSCLRVFLSIFDRTLTAHFLKTDDARANRFLLLKQLTLEVHDDTISDDNAPSSGSNELIKFKLQTLSTFATVIRFS